MWQKNGTTAMENNEFYLVNEEVKIGELNKTVKKMNIDKARGQGTAQ